MLNTFPHLLVLGFFAPTLLRIAISTVLFYGAYLVYKNRASAAKEVLPILGKIVWAGTLTALAYGAIGILLLVGAYTQIAAILGAIVSVKGLLFCRRFISLFPYSRSTYTLLFIISLSLIVSGAGALAFDLPL
jgi:hypothetical protein